jgi:hypothetical protein
VPNDEYDNLLLEAYRGEVFGAAFFAALADAQPDEARREKLKTLETVEARTATSLRRLLANRALHAGDPKVQRDQAHDLAAKIEPENWHELMQGLKDSLPEFLAKFERAREIAPNPSDPALKALVNHERAIERFAELELAGDGTGALRALEEHLRNPA